MRIALGSDHAGYHLKESVKAWLRDWGHEPIDFGASSQESVDYPDIAVSVAKAVAASDADRGVLICGTGIGMSIAANKIRGIRAALVYDETTARLSREHNDANVIALGARTSSPDQVKTMLDAWLSTEFAGGRHCQRIDKIRRTEDMPGRC